MHKKSLSFIAKKVLAMTLVGANLLSVAGSTVYAAESSKQMEFIPFRSYYLSYLAKHSGEKSTENIYLWCKMLSEQVNGTEHSKAGNWFATYNSEVIIPGGDYISESDVKTQGLYKDGVSNNVYDPVIANIIKNNGIEFLDAWVNGYTDKNGTKILSANDGKETFINFFDNEYESFPKTAAAIVAVTKTPEGKQWLQNYNFTKNGSNEHSLGIDLLKLMCTDFDKLDDDQVNWCKEYLPYLLINYASNGANGLAASTKNKELYDFMARSIEGAQYTGTKSVASVVKADAVDLGTVPAGTSLQQEFFDYVVASKKGFGSFVQNIIGGKQYTGAYNNSYDLSDRTDASSVLAAPDADIDYYTATANGGDEDPDWFDHAMYLYSVNKGYSQFATVYNLVTNNNKTKELYSNWLARFTVKNGETVSWEHRSEQKADAEGVLQYFEWMSADPNTMAGPSGTGEWGNMGNIGKATAYSNTDTFVTTVGGPRDHRTIQYGGGRTVSSDQGVGHKVTYRFDRGYISGFTWCKFESDNSGYSFKDKAPVEAGPWWLGDSHGGHAGVWRWTQPLNSDVKGFDKVKVTLQGLAEPYPDGWTYNNGVLIDTTVTVKVLENSDQSGSPIATASCKVNNLSAGVCTLAIPEQYKNSNLYLVIEMPLAAQQKTHLWAGAITSAKLAKVELLWSGANKCIDGHIYKDWTVKYSEDHSECILSHECKNCGVEETEVLSLQNGKAVKDATSNSKYVVFTYKPTIVNHASWIYNDPKDLGTGIVTLTANDISSGKVNGVWSQIVNTPVETVSHIKDERTGLWKTRTTGTFATSGMATVVSGTIKPNVKSVTINAESQYDIKTQDSTEAGSLITMLDIKVYDKNDKELIHKIAGNSITIDFSNLSVSEKEDMYMIIDYRASRSEHNTTRNWVNGWEDEPPAPTGYASSQITNIVIKY